MHKVTQNLHSFYRTGSYYDVYLVIINGEFDSRVNSFFCNVLSKLNQIITKKWKGRVRNCKVITLEVGFSTMYQKKVLGFRVTVSNHDKLCTEMA